jgi:cyclohexanone monooxygenase
VPAHNHRLKSDEVAEYKAQYPERRERARHSGYGVDTSSFPVGHGATMDLSDEEFEDRARKMWKAGGGTVQTAFPDFVVDAAANKRVADWINAKVRAAIPDQDLADKVCAKGHYLGAKRIIIIDGYTEALQQPNVSLVDVKAEPIERITPTGVRTSRGDYDLDMLIVATGFDSATGSILAIDLRGRNGERLADKWAQGHRTYLGLGVAGFPNMFVIAQAGSPGIRSHMMVSIEQHVDWIADLFGFAAAREVETIEASQEAERSWTEHVADVASRTLLTVDDTQHLGSNVPGKPRVVTSYLGGVGAYRKLCDAVREHHYEGWVLTAAAGPLPNDRAWSGPDRTIRWEDRDLEVGMEAGFL